MPKPDVVPLSPVQKRWLVGLSVVVAVTRWPALAQSPLGWDEAQFVSAVREYDVSAHHPHPPGYPLFIAFARLFSLLGVDEFQALQAVVLISAALLVPAAFMLAREMRFDVMTSLVGAAILAFLPNVWIFGGTAYSDVPALMCSLFACALLLRGYHSSRAFLLGGLLLGIAIGIRPLSILVGAVPFVWGASGRVRDRDRGAIAGAAVATVVIGAGSYLGAALASDSLAAYRHAVRAQTEWVRTVDSYQNEDRPSLQSIAQMFFMKPFDQPQQSKSLIVLASISLVSAVFSRRRPPVLVVLTFAPLAIASWLTLDVYSVGRYSMAYLFAYAVLAADGIGVLCRRTLMQPIVAAAGILAMATWTWPAIRLQATSDSPPVAALKWVDAQAAADEPIYVSGAFAPLGPAILPHRRIIAYDDENAMLPADTALWRVDWRRHPGGRSFEWPVDRLWRVVRRPGFHTSVVRLGEPGQ